MSFTVKIESSALADIAEAMDYVVQEAPQKAIEIAEELKNHFSEVLSQFPESGVRFKGRIRKLTHKKFTAFYVVYKDREEVRILHVVDLTKPLEARDIDL